MKKEKISYEKVYEEIEKNVEKFAEENLNKLFRYKISWNDSLSLVFRNFNKFGFKNIIKSSVNLYSISFNEFSEKMKEAKSKETHSFLEEFANECRSIRISQEAEPIRMKRDYCRNIYNWAIDKAKENGTDFFLFSNIFQRSFEERDQPNLCIKLWKGKFIRNFKLNLEENLN